MLLIGSRAIVHYFPDFRQPRDWDLYGTAAEIEELAQRVPRMKGKVPQDHRGIFVYDDAMVEAENIEDSPDWARIYEAFRDEPTIEEPVLGTLTLAPAAFLMLTKQCGLIYDIRHWHKNLEDLYFLRDRITSVPDVVTRVMPQVLAASRKMFAESTAVAAKAREPCYSADAEHSPDPPTELHAELHEAMAHGGAPLVSEPGAWQAYPDAEPAARREKMTRLFAEEAQVIAGEQLLAGGFGTHTEDERTAIRWALRLLITSRLPEGWRYFGVNYYREIMAAIPRGWSSHLAALSARYPPPEDPCGQPVVDLGCAGSQALTETCGQGPQAPHAAQPYKLRFCS